MLPDPWTFFWPITQPTSCWNKQAFWLESLVALLVTVCHEVLCDFCTHFLHLIPMSHHWLLQPLTAGSRNSSKGMVPSWNAAQIQLIPAVQHQCIGGSFPTVVEKKPSTRVVWKQLWSINWVFYKFLAYPQLITVFCMEQNRSANSLCLAQTGA